MKFLKGILFGVILFQIQLFGVIGQYANWDYKYASTIPTVSESERFCSQAFEEYFHFIYGSITNSSGVLYGTFQLVEYSHMEYTNEYTTCYGEFVDLNCTPVLPAPDNKTLIFIYENPDECEEQISLNDNFTDLECMVNYCENSGRKWYLYGYDKSSTTTCQETGTNYPWLAGNEKELFSWTADNDRSNECSNLGGSVQSRRVNCETEYRCVKSYRCEKVRRLDISSYVSPTAGVFHEDIALVGTDIALHY
ncbi:hypothetical protein, partial [Sulfurimonas sp.]